MVGLAFKPGTDDLRESPMVTLVETLIGKGCDVRILDRNVAIARLIGANRRYVEEEIPHVAALMCDDVTALLDHAEVLVIGNGGPDAVRALAAARADQVVIDLTRGGAWRGAPRRGEGERVMRGALRWLALAGLILAAGATARAVAQEPEAPRALVDTAPVAVTGRTLTVRAGGDLQAALDRAQPGDVVALEAGATFQGPFTLPRKSGEGWIVVRTAEPDASFPALGRRVTPAHARLMPKLVSAASPVVTAAPGAHHYRLVGLEIHPVPGAFVYDLVALGSDARVAEDQPHHIVIDRCYLHGEPGQGRAPRGRAERPPRRGDRLAPGRLQEAGADSQAIAGWRGPGPFKIANNYLEAAGENVMFGGGDPPIADLVPSDIEIRGNHLAKPLAWQARPLNGEGRPWTVKNLFELKNARRVVVEGNLFERNWAQAQTGFAVLFTVRNQDGGAPWSVVEDVTFIGNVVRHAGAGVTVLGKDDIKPSGRVRRITIRHNLFDDVGGERWGGRGTLFQILNGPAHVVIEHNTALQTGNMLVVEGPPPEGFVYRYNIVAHGPYGIIGTGTGPGRPTIERYFGSAPIVGNVIAGSGAVGYPRDNFLAASLDDVGFADRSRGDYRLGHGSRYRGAAGGRDPGVDWPALLPAWRAADAGAGG